MTAENANIPTPSDLDIVLEAGKLLMDSGAEIYRVEETMSHMAAALKIGQFSSYVVNRGIVISGTNRQGIQEAKVTSIPETGVHLGRLEAVNALSRDLERHTDIKPEVLAARLREIGRSPAPPLMHVLTANFLGAGCFAFAIGSPVMDSLCSAISGLVMGLVLHFAGKHVHTRVLMTIIGSAVITISANLLYLAGVGEHRGFIILGTLMLLVPGATFTNSVREFSQNNYATGLTLLMSALLTCLSIAVGVALTTELLPFVEQMTSVFSSGATSGWEIATRTFMAGLGTVAFAFLFHAPSRYFPDLGVLGAASWLLYLVMNMHFHKEIPAILIPALFVALCSRLLSVVRKCPVTIFLSTSIFPLIPGLSFYRAIYFMLTGADSLARGYMRNCFTSVFAIALAIMVIQQIPAGTLAKLGRRFDK